MSRLPFCTKSTHKNHTIFQQPLNSIFRYEIQCIKHVLDSYFHSQPSSSRQSVTGRGTMFAVSDTVGYYYYHYHYYHPNHYYHYYFGCTDLTVVDCQN